MLKKKNHAIDMLFTIALFCVFAVTALLTVLIGAEVYQNTVTTMEGTFANRTSLSYIAEKVRQNDAEGAIALGEIDGAPALVIAQAGTEGVYTYIYLYEGNLTELLVGPNSILDPAFGQAVLPLESLTFALDGNLLTASAVGADGDENSLSLFIHTAIG